MNPLCCSASKKNQEKKDCFTDLSSLTLFITDRCNANCAQCFRSSTGRKEATFQHLQDIIRAFPRLKDLYYCGGEPTLHPDIRKLLEFGIENGNTPRFTTNGIRPLSEVLDGLSPDRVGVTTISIDSIIPELHDFLRGRTGTLNAALDSLTYLMANDFDACTQTTVSRVNLETLIPTYEALYDMGVRNFRTHLMSIEGARAELAGLVHLSPTEWRYHTQLLDDFADRHPDVSLHYPYIFLREDEISQILTSDEIEEILRHDHDVSYQLPFTKCRALKEDNFALYATIGNGTCYACPLGAENLHLTHSEYNPESKRMEKNLNSPTSQMPFLRKSHFLCPASPIATGLSHNVIVENGVRYFIYCRYFNNSQLKRQ